MIYAKHAADAKDCARQYDQHMMMLEQEEREKERGEKKKHEALAGDAHVKAELRKQNPEHTQ